jgi:hypothetical protein
MICTSILSDYFIFSNFQMENSKFSQEWKRIWKKAVHNFVAHQMACEWRFYVLLDNSDLSTGWAGWAAPTRTIPKYTVIDSLRVTFVLLLLSILSVRQKLCCHAYIRDENAINSVTAQMDIRILLLTENICNERTTKVTWWVNEWLLFFLILMLKIVIIKYYNLSKLWFEASTKCAQ